MSDFEVYNTEKKTLKVPISSAVIIAVSFLVIVICLAVAVIVLAVGNSKKDDEPEIVEFIPVVNNRAYDFYDEDDIIVFEDSYFGDIWLRAYTEVPRNSYDYNGLAYNNGRYTYTENDEVISKTGIDVSYHNGEIDWQRVAADGIDFAILRVGYRGYESGDINLDSEFHSYISGAKDAGIEVGVYFFSQALNAEEAVEEANFVMEQVKDYDLEYPIVFDWEITESETSRTNDIAPYTVTECAAAFCDTISDGGYIPMVYGGFNFSMFKMDMRKLGNYDFWYAEYKHGHNEPMYPYDFKIWQYASDGRVDGIEGDVDLNICFDNFYDRVPVTE